jgi:phenylacetate-coenzyme A ligase PaaK-like adenylate-forming protein
MNLFPGFDLMAASRWASVAPSIVAATYAPAPMVAQLARTRYDALVRHARARSPFYSERLKHLPDRPRLEDLPRVSRAELMARFDQWVTDPDIRRSAIDDFIADPVRCGDAFLGRYAVWTSSGTSGVPGVYVSDPDALAVHDALLALRGPSLNGAAMLWQTLAGGGRLAMIAARDGHFAGIASWERARRAHPWLQARCRSLSVTQPIDDLVTELNTWQPALLASYPSVLSALGESQESGRLHIRPSTLWCGGEELTAIERKRLEQVFGCSIHEEYAASECMNIAFSCQTGALHLNADWVILEPVDERGQPVPAGQPSAETLLTNLSNRVQPLIRYQLGDSITMLAEPCSCGCPLPALRVEGRHDDVLQLPSAGGKPITIVPLAIESVIEDRAGVHQFQLEQRPGNTLSIRLNAPPQRTPNDAWRSVRRCLREFLDAHGAHATRIVFDPAAPIANRASGKLRRVHGIARPPTA